MEEDRRLSKLLSDQQGFSSEQSFARNMAFLYFDDSKHHRYGFSIAALVACDFDPDEALINMFVEHGYDPSTFEFKSSAKMTGDQKLQRLRLSMREFLAANCSIGVCIVGEDQRLGPASLELLNAALKHPTLSGGDHEIYFDQSLFGSVHRAEKLLQASQISKRYSYRFEQDSREVRGIQLADIAAHTCATILSATLGYITKKVTLEVPRDELYDGLEVELSFEMWARIRYAFLRQNKPAPKCDDDLATVDVFPWGLFIDGSVDRETAAGATKRFAEMYLGCIH